MYRAQSRTGCGPRGVDVLTAQEDGTTEEDDDRLLDRATQLHRVLITQDQDFHQIAAERQRKAEFFFGICFAPQNTAIGVLIRDLEMVALLGEPHEFADRVE